MIMNLPLQPLLQPSAFKEVTRISRSLSLDDILGAIAIVVGLCVYLLRGVVWDKPDPHGYLLFERPQEKISGLRKSIEKEIRNIAKKVEDTQKEIVVFWGSQSGTAEGFANRLARELHTRFGLDALAADLSDFDAESIASLPSTRKAIFVLSTYGEGDPSDNTTEFWNWVNKSDASLGELQYAAFGLGNSNYKYYNQVVTSVSEALDRKGATRLMPIGRGDDSKGSTEDDFIVWKEGLFQILGERFGYQEQEVRYLPNITVESATSIDCVHYGDPIQPKQTTKGTTPGTTIHPLAVKASRELCPHSSRLFLHLELDLSSYPELKYKTGDHLAVWPSNPDVEVDRLVKVLEKTESRHDPISIQQLNVSSDEVNIPTPSSLSTIFRHYLSICAPVPRETIQSLIQFAPSETVKSSLLQLLKDRKAYSQLLSKHQTLGQLLELATDGDGTWAALPLSWVLEYLPPLQPRLYSISSSSVVQPRQAAITAVVISKAVSDNVPGNAYGLATNYLLALQKSLIVDAETGPRPHPHGLSYALDGPNQILKGGKVFAQIRKSKFKLPLASTCPIIMVGAGTGLAPFRGFIQERARVKSMGLDVGRTSLFFGCRRCDEDYIYRDELHRFRDRLDGALEIQTAFSRQDRKGDDSKVYVQDRIAEQEEEVCRQLVETNCCFYICGSANMAREVTKVVSEALKRFNSWDETQLRGFMDRLKRNGRWQEDVWG
ncbi:MAG: hypothetical protein Q9190_001273 [Brigantiaea leucoxantha]